jgi:hypothetical protein
MSKPTKEPRKDIKKATHARITPHLDTFAGVKLEPMTPQREVVAAEMGLRWGFVSPYVRQYLLRDSVIVVWLRSIPVEAVTNAQQWCVDRAEVEPYEAMREAMVWAGKKGIRINAAPFKEATAILVSTMTEIAKATGEPADAPEPEPPDDSGEL